MPSTLDQYRQAKTTYLKLRDSAKKDLIARANELAAEIGQIQRELREDFGHKWPFPKNGRPRKRAIKPEPAPKPTPQIARIQRQIEAQKSKLAAATDPAQSKRISDRIYELEDQMRLEGEK